MYFLTFLCKSAVIPNPLGLSAIFSTTEMLDIVCITKHFSPIARHECNACLKSLCNLSTPKLAFRDDVFIKTRCPIRLICTKIFGP